GFCTYSCNQVGDVNVDLRTSEHARVLLQPGKTFDADRVPGMAASYRNRLGGARAEITKLWLWPQSGEGPIEVRYPQGFFSRKEEVVPLSPSAPREAAKAGGVELRAKMSVFCISAHHEGENGNHHSDHQNQEKPEPLYRLGYFEGLTIAARTGLA